MRGQEVQHRMVAPAELWDRLIRHLTGGSAERMAFGYCPVAQAGSGRSFLLREVCVPGDGEYAAQEPTRVVLGAAATIPYLLRAKGVAALADAHSHPGEGAPVPSAIDNAAARRQLASLQAVAPGAALVRIIANTVGVVWAGVESRGDLQCHPLEEIRLHGPGGIRMVRPVNARAPGSAGLRPLDARNLTALGRANLLEMRNLHIAVIGLGGVGAQVARLVAPLVGRLTLIDPDQLVPHNAPRLWYAGAATRGAKVEVARRALLRAFPGLEVTARVEAFPSPATLALVAEADTIMVCPDHHAVRVSASRAAAAAMLPLVEAGCGGRMDSGVLSALGYHVRLQYPGGPCLACNGLDTSRLEDPATTREKRRLGYIENAGEVQGELGILTARAAADAVDVLLRYWTRYAGPPPSHLYFDALRFKTLDLSGAFAPRPECPVCGEAAWRTAPGKPPEILPRPGVTRFDAHPAPDGVIAAG